MLKVIHKIEHAVADSFIRMSQSSHWLFTWIIFFVSWVIWREFFKHDWYNADLDLLVITITSAIIPAWTEYGMKFQQRWQLEQQSNQMKMVENQIKLLEDQSALLVELTKLNIEMSKKTLISLDELSDDIEDIADDIDGTTEEEESDEHS